MSADEFDPEIERLFARSPSLPDTALFTAEVESRLTTGSRLRSVVLTLAGVVGGGVALRELVGSNLNFAGGGEVETVRRMSSGVEGASIQAGQAVQTGLAGLGLDSVDLSAFGGMQLFWVVASGLVVLAATGLVRLSQDV